MKVFLWILWCALGVWFASMIPDVVAYGFALCWGGAWTMNAWREADRQYALDKVKYEALMEVQP